MKKTGTKTTAIVLAGGRGSRMKSDVNKLFLQLNEKPVLYYCLKVFQDSPVIDEIILVCSGEEMEKCRREVLRPYGFTKISAVVQGGRERYHSVYEGLKAAGDCDYVMIHDGARPFVDDEMLMRIQKCLEENEACIVGVPVKDTIKQVNREDVITATPSRAGLWSAQTPQSFRYEPFLKAYEKSFLQDDGGLQITDDAMVAEYYGGIPVKMIMGSYENIKITTQDDLLMAGLILNRRVLPSSPRNPLQP